MPRKSPPAPVVLGASLVPEIRDLVQQSREYVAATANLALVWLYWNVGRLIASDIQKNVRRANYGDELIPSLAQQLSEQLGRGFSAPNLWDMKRFHGQFEILQTVSRELSGPILSMPSRESSVSEPRLPVDFAMHSHLGWSHYRRLLYVADERQRAFYFERAAKERWSVRELDRQIESALFQRVALSRDTRKLAAIERKKGPTELVRYEDVFKDPYVLDFLGLKGAYSEKDLEAAIIRNIEEFLAELGTDFCFIARQFPMRIDDIDHSLDLLFYHRGLRCLVAIDLKIGGFIAADKGQMDLYLSWLKEHEWRDGESEPVGLVLCTSKRRQHVELLLRHGPHKLQVAEYVLKPPQKKALEARLKLYGRLLEK